VTSQITAVVLYFICKFNTPTAIEDEFTALYGKHYNPQDKKQKLDSSMKTSKSR